MTTEAGVQTDPPPAGTMSASAEQSHEPVPTGHGERARNALLFLSLRVGGLFVTAANLAYPV